MRHQLILRIVAFLAVLLAAASALFAWITRGATVTPTAAPVDSAAGSELFALHCSGCHEQDEMLAVLTVSAAARGRSAALDALMDLLDDHGAATEGEDRRIVDHLARRAWETSP